MSEGTSAWRGARRAFSVVLWKSVDRACACVCPGLRFCNMHMFIKDGTRLHAGVNRRLQVMLLFLFLAFKKRPCLLFRNFPGNKNPSFVKREVDLANCVSPGTRTVCRRGCARLLCPSGSQHTADPTGCHRAVAGAVAGTAELLPSPSGSLNWTVGLPTDNGHDSDQVFEFNGTQAVRVPEGVVSVNPKEPFTVSVWMRHGPSGRRKEAILCSSDRAGERGSEGRVPLVCGHRRGGRRGHLLPPEAPRGWVVTGIVLRFAPGRPVLRVSP